MIWLSYKIVYLINKKSNKFTIKKVRNWEKKWVTIEDTDLRVLRWMPIITQKRKLGITDRMKMHGNRNLENFETNLENTIDSNLTLENTGLGGGIFERVYNIFVKIEVRRAWERNILVFIDLGSSLNSYILTSMGRYMVLEKLYI